MQLVPSHPIGYMLHARPATGAAALSGSDLSQGVHLSAVVFKGVMTPSGYSIVANSSPSKSSGMGSGEDASEYHCIAMMTSIPRAFIG